MPAPQHAGPGGSERALARTAAALPARRFVDLAVSRPLGALAPVARTSLMLAGAVFAAEYAARSLVGGALGLIEPAAEQVQHQGAAVTRTVITEWTVLERLSRR